MVNKWKSDPKDVELESLVARRIRDKLDNLHVTAKGGHVILSGTADEFEIKREVVEMVREIGGVREVTDNIKVVPIGGSEYEA